jgi:hypothetical protein
MVRKSFPFKQPAFSAVWLGNEASVYAWEDSIVREAQDNAGAPRGAVVVPETFIRSPGQDGARLTAMLDGVEGQYWTKGFLRSSRWWPDVPDHIEWRKFLRSVGFVTTEDNELPTALELPILDRPWSEGTFSFDDWSSLLQSRRVQAVAATAALCPFVFLAGQITVLSFSENALATESASLTKASQSVRADRAAAYENLDAIEALLALDEYPAHVSILSAAMTLLANTGNPQVVSWAFDRGNVELVLRSGIDLDPTTYITLLERDPRFESVSGTLVGQDRHLQLRMTVTKLKTSQAAP